MSGLKPPTAIGHSRKGYISVFWVMNELCKAFPRFHICWMWPDRNNSFSKWKFHVAIRLEDQVVASTIRVNPLELYCAHSPEDFLKVRFMHMKRAFQKKGVDCL